MLRRVVFACTLGLLLLLSPPALCGDPSQPQDPEPPFPYRVETVAYRNGPVQLAGTLTLPPGPGPHPAVILVTGSGSQDRDYAFAGHRPFLVLADNLTRAGLAVLRTDDRGVGGSTGLPDTTTTLDLAGDVHMAWRYLAGRPDIDAQRIGFVGHSEGASAAVLAAGLGEPAFLVLLAPPAVPGWRVLLEQKRAQMVVDPVPRPDDQLALYRAALDIVVHTEDPRAMELALYEVSRRQVNLAFGEAGVPDKQGRIRTAVARSMTPWFVFFARYDPVPALERVRVPVLGVWGSMDLQVPPSQNLKAFREALAGNPDVRTAVLLNVNHQMQTCQKCTLDEVPRLRQTLTPELLDLLREWIPPRVGLGD